MECALPSREKIKTLPFIGKVSPETTIHEEEVENKKKIVSYMNRGKIFSAAAGMAKDVFTGETIKRALLVMTDGEYVWRSDAIYYLEKYNIDLPSDFIDHIMRKLGNNDLQKGNSNG